MSKTVRTRHTVSGKIAEVPEAIYNHSVLGRYLERVDEDAKPYLPEMHKPAKAVVVQDTFEALDATKSEVKSETDKDKN